MRRGDIVVYDPVLAARPNVSRLRLITAANDLIESDSVVVYGIPVTDDDRGGMFSVRLRGHGWVSALSNEAVIRRRLSDVVGQASPEEMQAVDIALRAALDL